MGIDNVVANDIRLSYMFRLSHLWHAFEESATLQPTLDLYNVANKANFDPPGGFITSPLRGSVRGVQLQEVVHPCPRGWRELLVGHVSS